MDPLIKAVSGSPSSATSFLSRPWNAPWTVINTAIHIVVRQTWSIYLRAKVLQMMYAETYTIGVYVDIIQDHHPAVVLLYEFCRQCGFMRVGIRPDLYKEVAERGKLEELIRADSWLTTPIEELLYKGQFEMAVWCREAKPLSLHTLWLHPNTPMIPDAVWWRILKCLTPTPTIYFGEVARSMSDAVLATLIPKYDTYGAIKARGIALIMQRLLALIVCLSDGYLVLISSTWSLRPEADATYHDRQRRFLRIAQQLPFELQVHLVWVLMRDCPRMPAPTTLADHAARWALV
jgi:ribosomal protein S27AE